MKLWYIRLRKKFWLPHIYRWHRETKIEGVKFSSKKQVTDVYEELELALNEARQHGQKEIELKILYAQGIFERIVKL